MWPNNWHALAVCAVFAVAGCDTSPPDWVTQEKPANEPAQKAGIEEFALKAVPSPNETATVPSKSSRNDSLASIPPDANPQQLIGLESRGLADMLGSPGFVRRDGKAEVWQYPAESCILDIFLYRDKGTLSVDYVELRGRGTAQLSRQDCYRRMLQTHLTREQG